MDPTGFLGLIPTAYKLIERLYDPKLKEKERKNMAYDLIATSLKSFIYRWKNLTIWKETRIYAQGKEIARTHQDLFLNIMAKTDSIVDKKVIGWLDSIACNLNIILDHHEFSVDIKEKAFIEKGERVQKYCEKALKLLENIKGK